MKKHIKRISLMIVCIILLLVGIFCIYYFSRFRTLSSIQKVTSYEDGYNLYQIDIKYDYDLDQIIDYGITDNQSMIDAIIKTKLLRIRRMESTDTEENVTMLFLRLLKQKQNIPILPYGML